MPLFDPKPYLRTRRIQLEYGIGLEVDEEKRIVELATDDLRCAAERTLPHVRVHAPTRTGIERRREHNSPRAIPGQTPASPLLVCIAFNMRGNLPQLKSLEKAVEPNLE
jgi:hypothetical protein